MHNKRSAENKTICKYWILFMDSAQKIQQKQINYTKKQEQNQKYLTYAQ